MAEILFPGGVRLSTWLMLIAFLVLAAWRGDGRPFLAALAWLWGFEAVYQVTCIVTGNGSPASPISQVMLICFGVASVAAASWYGVYPSWPIMALAAAAWIIWIAVGLPVSLPTRFNATAEALNEPAKLLWAFAYLWPLVRPMRLGKAPSAVAGLPRV